MWNLGSGVWVSLHLFKGQIQAWSRSWHWQHESSTKTTADDAKWPGPLSASTFQSAYVAAQKAAQTQQWYHKHTVKIAGENPQLFSLSPPFYWMRTLQIRSAIWILFSSHFVFSHGEIGWWCLSTKNSSWTLWRGLDELRPEKWRDPTAAPQAGLDVNYSDWALIAVFGP